MDTISPSRVIGAFFGWLYLLSCSAVQVMRAFATYAAAVVLLWQDRARERHRLQTLDDRMLRDIGLSRATVEREIRKPFWQP